MSTPLAAIQQHFDLQSAQLALAEQTLKTHFNSELPTHLNPVGLLARLRAIQAEMPQMIERQQRIAREKQAALEEVDRLTQANRDLLTNIASQVSQTEEQLHHAAAASSLSSSSTLPHLSISSSSPTRSAKKKSRPSTAPTMTPSKEMTMKEEVVGAGKTRRKSMRSAAPPSPSTLQEAALLDAISVSSELEGPISEKEFAGVSTTVKSRVKLADVNAMLTTIQQHFQRFIQQHKVKDPSQLPPLTLTALATDGAGAVKIGGASGQVSGERTPRATQHRRGSFLFDCSPLCSLLSSHSPSASSERCERARGSSSGSKGSPW
jgi:hypothetical protein